MPDFLSFINEILWGSVMIYLLLVPVFGSPGERSLFSSVIFASLAKVLKKAFARSPAD